MLEERGRDGEGEGEMDRERERWSHVILDENNTDFAL